MTEKTDLVFDFSNMAMRAVFTCSYAAKGQVSTFDTEEECAILIRKMAMDMAYVLRIFNPDRVIVACDARHPWRNEIYKDIENETYKGNRSKDDTKNWDNIFKALNDYKKILEEKGFVVTELYSAEADDVAALWRKSSFEDGRSVVLVSSDKDWTQLAGFNPGLEQFCICFNPIAGPKGKKKLSATQEFSDWMNTNSNKNDIFFSNYSSYKENVLKQIQQKDPKIELDIIDANMVVLEKIMCGDDGDNAPSIYEFYKNGKKVRVTPSRSKKIYEELNISTVSDLCQAAAAGALVPALAKIFKIEDVDIEPNERVMRQRKLVELNPILFPDEIVKTFGYHLKEVKDENLGCISCASITLNEILADTKFLPKDGVKPKAKESGIFDNLKDLDNILKRNTTSLF